MKLIKVDCFQLQGAERGFELMAHIRRREIIGAVQEAFEVVAKFRGNDPMRVVVAAQVVTNQALGKVIPVTLGGINQVDPGRGGLVEDRIDFNLGIGAPPLAAELPGAQADDGDG